MNYEQTFIGSCLQDGANIDLAIQDGLVPACFTTDDRRDIWGALLGNRTEGRQTDTTGIFMQMGTKCPSEELFACEAAAPTTAYAKQCLKTIIEAYGISLIKPALKGVLEKIDKGLDYDAVKSSVDALESILRPSVSQDVSMPQVVDEASLWATQQCSGKVPVETVVVLGLKTFDALATPIQEHEYVVVGARTSTGKSSFMAQVAGHNLRRGLRVAYFTLETSSKSLVLQIAAQRAGVNLRNLRDEFPPQQAKFQQELAHLRTQPLLVFDRDLTLDKIEARCRLLATSFKPNLVIIDYLGLIKVKADGAYERMSALSKAMIPLKKTLGCTLMVAAQLNRGNEREDRPPNRTDFRDTGSIEEDAHRVLAIHRPSKDDSGELQGLDRSSFQTELYQLKLRDGPLAQSRCQFQAKYTRFVE